MPRVQYCYVKGCPGKAGWQKPSPLTFFSVPSIIRENNKRYSAFGKEERKKELIELSIKRRQAWLKAIKRDNKPDNQWIKVCGRHFISGRPAHLEDVDNPDWVPTVNLDNKTNKTGKIKSALKKYEQNKIKAKRMEAVKLYGGSLEPPVFIETEGYEEVLVPKATDESSSEEGSVMDRENIGKNGEIPVEAVLEDDAHSTNSTTTDGDEKHGHWHVHFCTKKECLFSKAAAKSNSTRFQDEDVLNK